MKKFNITVNGVSYEVEVEEVSSTSSVVKNDESTPVKSEPVKVSKNDGAGESIKAPMPGKILKVNTSSGSSVKKGDILVILEAMKMENEIKAPRDGRINTVNIIEGQTVDTGDDMLFIE